MAAMRFLTIFGAVILSALLFAACEEDDAPTGGGSDEDYLRAICTGSQDFSNALLSKTNPDEIAEVIRDFIEKMEATNPPADLVEYNEEFVQYLEDAVNEPTSLVTRQPPLPDDDVQRRLASKEPTVAECKDPTFFSRTPAP
jgi:hypothetical protein